MVLSALKPELHSHAKQQGGHRVVVLLPMPIPRKEIDLAGASIHSLVILCILAYACRPIFLRSFFGITIQSSSQGQGQVQDHDHDHEHIQ